MEERYALQVQGIVQGVGFRPFVYRLATDLSLTGWVLNCAAGVFIQIQGQAGACAQFRRRLEQQPPPLAKIDFIDCQPLPPQEESSFVIRESAPGERRTLLSPDVATCDDCLADLQNPDSRMYQYPFANCTNCGPRFTIIGDIPYDRALTTMADFPMCDACAADFTNPYNRRFHAQPIACPACGPRLVFLHKDGSASEEAQPLAAAQKALQDGQILAIKGLGGYHLACDPHNEQAVCQLRRRKYRYDKPLALMVRDLETACRYCLVDAQEEELLTGRRRPIVLLRKRADGIQIAPSVAPGTDRLGIMLPYTPLHHLLLAQVPALVMTSGNVADEPIAYQDEDALTRLAPIVDGFLSHNRRIFRRCDDSVAVVAAGAPRLLRRSRGYVPEPLTLPWAGKLLALGGQQKNVFCLLREQQAFLSQHQGDLDEQSTFAGYRQEIADFCRMFAVQPQLLVHDLHPGYQSTAFAREFAGKLPLVAVQHHHAHLASVLAEQGWTDPAIGLIFDGTGYGSDGALWGGEVLLGDCRGFRRMAHLLYAPMPGGEAAVKEPWRMTLSYLAAALPEQRLPEFAGLWLEGWQVLLQAVRRGVNAPLTSGMGRLFDGMAVLAGLPGQVSYEGQVAIGLEQLAVWDGEDIAYSLPLLRQGEETIMDWRPAMAQAAADRLAGVAPCRIAGRFHRGVVEMAVAAAVQVRQQTGVALVALSGGCWQNILLLEKTVDALSRLGFTVCANQQVPVNDGGLALGQAAIAAAGLAPACS